MLLYRLHRQQSAQVASCHSGTVSVPGEGNRRSKPWMVNESHSPDLAFVHVPKTDSRAWAFSTASPSNLFLYFRLICGVARKSDWFSEEPFGAGIRQWGKQKKPWTSGSAFSENNKKYIKHISRKEWLVQGKLEQVMGGRGGSSP